MKNGERTWGKERGEITLSERVTQNSNVISYKTNMPYCQKDVTDLLYGTVKQQISGEMFTFNQVSAY